MNNEVVRLAEYRPCDFVASRLAKCLEPWRRFDAARQKKAQVVLEGLMSAPLSKSLRDVVQRLLQ